MSKIIASLISLFFLSSFHLNPTHRTFCFPENDLSFPINAKVSGGLTEQEYNNVLDEIEAVMWTEVNNVEGGAKLIVERLWENNAVNAYAVQYGIYRQISFFGGLARHPLMNTDVLRLIACHEIGHHLAGRPYWPERDPANPLLFIEGTESWSSSEGEADYYASLRCFRQLVIEGRKLNLDIESPDLSTIDPNEYSYAQNKCLKSFSKAIDQEICIRSSLAGYVSGRVFSGLSKTNSVSLTTPSTKVVTTTDYTHPEAQCRTDTYFQGSLCDISYRENLLKEDPNWKTCNRRDHYTVGLRPLCWYKPI